MDTSQWYHYDVDFVLENKYMIGYSATEFGTNDPVTRGQIVTILYRMTGEPAVSGRSEFKDVPSGEWYCDAVIWGEKNGIVKGYGDGTFGPNDPVTREQLATFLQRYATYMNLDDKPSGSLNSFTDASKVSSWAMDPVKWAVGHGIVNGTTETTLSPQDTATRVQIAAMIHRFKMNIG